MEACATAHHWARELIALGHEVRLMPPAYVKAYVKRNKNDAADAEAICEAVTRPSMRFVPVKDAEQQAALMMHRARNLLVRQRTMLVNALARASGRVRHHRAAGICASRTADRGDRSGRAAALPELARSILRVIVAQLNDTQAKIQRVRGEAGQWHRNSGSANCWRPFLASGHGRERDRSDRAPIRPCSARGGSSRPGWA